MSRTIFVSHSRRDNERVAEVCEAISRAGGRPWVDWEELSAGVELPAALETAIENARGLVAVLTPASLESEWVRREVEHALAVAKKREDGYRVVPVLDGVERGDLPASFKAIAERLWVSWDEPGAPDAIVEAFGLRPARELRVDFKAPRLVEAERDGVKTTRVEAVARVGSAGGGRLRAPVGRLEAEDLRWYLERYHRWPAEAFAERARKIERRIPGWGRALWKALREAVGEAPIDAWLEERDGVRRLLTVGVSGAGALGRDPDGADPEAAARARGAAALLALPWELLRDEGGYLFEKNPRVAIRRVIDAGGARWPAAARSLRLPIRVLVVVARPEKAGLIDPRATALGLLDAVEPLGAAVEVDFLRPPTLPALAAALRGEKPYHVLHFDGHGCYDPHTGLGVLCFEHPDPKKRAVGEIDRVSGTRLREAIGETRLPLAFLEACQSAEGGEEPGSAVAAALLAAGAESVIAMSHSVLVETARRFTAALYDKLCAGLCVGDAVAEARHGLLVDRDRGRGGGGLPFALSDWFVPLLLQRGSDRALLPGGAAVHAEPATVERRRGLIASLPTLEHDFIGRIDERLAIERAFEPGARWEHGGARLLLLLGEGGQGKTTLAVEAARWLFRTGRFPGGVAFVSLEFVPDLAAVVSGLGRLVLPGFALESDAPEALDAAVAQIRAALRETAHLVILDNLETVLRPPGDAPAAERLTHDPDLRDGLLELAAELAGAGESRVVVTCREPIDDPRFQPGNRTRVLRLGGLPARDAVALVGHICALRGVRPEATDEAAREEMVEAVGGHPRSLVLLPALLEGRDLGAVTADLHRLMTELEARHPGERERSLYASLSLSLDRLPRGVREAVRPLGLLRVGVFDQTLGVLLELDEAERERIIDALAARALLHREGGYLRFHPALAPYLEAELRADRDAEAVEALWARAVEAYVELAGVLYKMMFGARTDLAYALTLRELPNLLRVLDHLEAEAGEDAGRLGAAIGYATDLEGLLADTPRQRALRGVAERRAGLARRLDAVGGAWSHARHLAARAAVERLLGTGRLGEAVEAARALVDRGEAAAAGGGGYAGAPYDRAQAWVASGRALSMAGRPEAGLEAIERARRGFKALAQAGNQSAARMASACLTEGADCLTALGRLSEAATSSSTASRTRSFI